METAAPLVLLALAVLAITGVSERAGWPTPLVLIGAGIGVSFLPFVRVVQLDQDIVLFGLLPPLLYAAALNTSLVDFAANRRPILLLSVGLVVFTTLGVGWLVHLLIPGIGWAAALAIGAVLAPPDAVAATAIGRRIGLPRRLVNILEGESLLNDATALVGLRMAIAAMSASVDALDIGLDFARAVGGGVLVGYVVFVAVGWVRQHIREPLIDNALSFVTPFSAYVVAEQLHGSGVIAVVLAGMLLAHQAPIHQTASSRVAERRNWRTISFVLENAVFFIMGLQASWVLGKVSESELRWERILGVCAACLLAVIALRLIWVFPARYLLVRPGPDRLTGRVPPWTYTFIVGWAGMRGVVTLAGAYLLPVETEYREVLLLIAFTTVAGTLFVQGLTLPWLAERLRVPPPDPVEDALARAALLHQASAAGLELLPELDEEDPHGSHALATARVEQRNFAAWERVSRVTEDETPSEAYVRVRQLMLAAERAKVLQVRDSGTVASDIVRDVLGMLDIEESMLDMNQRARTRVRASIRERALNDGCPELAAASAANAPAAPTPGVCAACEREGTSPVHLRMCMSCATVGCCDSSVGRHADRHYRETGHPVMISVEPGESWRWCYLHEALG
ncbi:MAG: Na+/H+ antiporter [Nocardioides sp.]